MTWRKETFAQSGLVERTEIERIDGSTVEYRRYDGSLVIQEQRPATPDEIETVDTHEAGVVLDQKRTNVEQAVTALRSWAEDAQNTTVTTGNHETVTQTVVDRLGVFFDRFADLIETRL
jgi:hypothetical protein